MGERLVGMGIITNIENTKKKDNRKNIFVDEEYICTLSDFCVFKNKLVVGLEITEQELQDYQIESDVDLFFPKIVQMQTKSMKTAKQVQEYLKDKGCLFSTIQILMDKLNNYKYVNDEIYAKRYLERYKKTKGKQKIKFELRQKGIDDCIIDMVLSEVDNQCDEVWELSVKYMKNKTINYENTNKLMRYLSGKGFEMEDIRGVLQRLKQGEKYEDRE